MNITYNEYSKAENNLIKVLLSKLIRYWPVFIILLAVLLTAAYFYIKSSTEYFEASASILFKDEKKGSDESKITESLNYLSSKKIVENEIEVLHSKYLMKEVINTLHLYAVIYDETSGKPKIAYKDAPILIEANNINSITPVLKVPFVYNIADNTVTINNNKYSCDTWVNTSYGLLKFSNNPKASNTNKKYFFSLKDPKAVVQSYLARLTITPVSKLSSVVTLRLIDELPQRAEDVLNGIITSYNTVSNREKVTLAQNTLSFIDARLRSVKHDLDSIEHKIQQYKSGKQAIDIGQQGQLFLQNVSTNDQKLSDINMQLAVLNQVEKFATNSSGNTGIVPSTLGVSDPLLNQLLGRLYNAELEYEKNKKTSGENNPVLLEIKDEINKIKPSILENIRSQKKSLEASKSNLNSTNSSYSNVIQAIPKKERDLLEISREQSVKTTVYNFLLQKREETGFSNLPSSLDYTIIDFPDGSLTPVSPNKKLIYLSSVFASLLLGIAFVLIKELFNKKITLRYDIENLTTLPIIGEIGFRKSKDNMLLDGQDDPFLIDQFQRLRTSFSYLGIDSLKKRILITSTIAGEGKSFTAAQLSITLANSGKKVVLLEADLSNPSLHQTFGDNRVVGISNFLLQEVEAAKIIKQTDYANLSIIPAGTPTNNSAALLVNGRIEKLLQYLEQIFDYIIIDSAPVGLLSDAYILSPYCDATLYIIRQNYSPKDFVQRILDENTRFNKFKNIAIVFNGVQPDSFSPEKYGYGYGYPNGKKMTKRIANKSGF